MDQEKLQVIKELMDELMGDMQPSSGDFDSRLGKPKQVDMMAIKAGGGDMEGAGGKDAMDGMSSMGKDGDADGGDMDMDDMMSPEDKLKQRIMSLRG